MIELKGFLNINRMSSRTFSSNTNCGHEDKLLTMAKLQILLVITLIAVVQMSEMDEQDERGSIYDDERPDTHEDFTNVDLTDEPSIKNYRLVKRNGPIWQAKFKNDESSGSRCVQCCSSQNGGSSPHYRGSFWEVDSRSLSRGNPLGATQIASAVNEGSSRGGWKATQIASARNDGSVRNGPWKSDQGGYYDGLSNRNQWKSNKFPSAVNQGGVVSGPWSSHRGQKLNQISSAVSDGSVRNGPFISVGGGGYRLNDETYQKPENGYSNGENGYSNGENGYSNGENGYSNGENGYSNGENGYSNGENGYSNGENGYSNGENGYSNGENGLLNGGNGPVTDYHVPTTGKPGKSGKPSFVSKDGVVRNGPCKSSPNVVTQENLRRGPWKAGKPSFGSKGGGGGAPRGSLKKNKFPMTANNGPRKHQQVPSSGLGPGWKENTDQICQLFSQMKGDRMVVEIEDQDGSGKDITVDCNVVDPDEDSLESTLDDKKRDVASQAGTNDQATAREGDRQKSRSVGSFGPNDKNTGVANKIRITIKPNLKSNNQNSTKTKVTKIM